MKKSTLAMGVAAASMVAASLVFTGPASAMGDYLRKDKDTITVAVKGDKLYCTRAGDNFEMCNGMTKQGNVWKGKGMKHPDMPGFMTFNGTVSIGESGLSIKGCAMGNSMCDKEKWVKKPAE